MLINMIGKIVKIIFKWIGLDALVHPAIDVLVSLCISSIKKFHQDQKELKSLENKS